MGVSFTWRLVETDRKPVLRGGSSSDIAVLDEMFPSRVISSDDIRLLRGMAKTSFSGSNSLWGEIADKLEALQGDDYDKKIAIVIEPEF